MTAKRERSDEGRVTRDEGSGERLYCFECAAFVDDANSVFGICGNERSDHCGHVISFMHAACGEIRFKSTIRLRSWP